MACALVGVRSLLGSPRAHASLLGSLATVGDGTIVWLHGHPRSGSHDHTLVLPRPRSSFWLGEGSCCAWVQPSTRQMPGTARRALASSCQLYTAVAIGTLIRVPAIELRALEIT